MKRLLNGTILLLLMCVALGLASCMNDGGSDWVGKWQLRYVLVPGYSSFEEDIRALGEHFKNYQMIQRVEILPYHTLGVHKYEAMGKEYKLNGIKENTLKQLETAKTLFGEYFNTVYLN